VPPLPVVPDDFAARLAASGAQVVLGPRTGSKTVDLQIPAALPPGSLASVLPVRVWRVESLRPNVREAVRLTGSASLDDGVARHWRDLLDTSVDEGPAKVETLARFADGHPAYVRSGATHYFASIFDDALTTRLFNSIAREAGIATTQLGDGIRVSRRGGLTYVLNYSEEVHTLADVDANAFVVGSRDIEPQGVAVYRTT
jgi:beta-galactosidase